jgi:Domain of unknown function (DUF4383)
MAHIPVNHPLRPLYRALAVLVGAYVLLFGIIGLARTWGDDPFARDSVWVLGLRTNLAFAILSILFGVVILGANLLAGNAGHLVNLTAAVIFLVAGVGMMALMQTSGNILNFSMSTVVLSLVFGLLLLTAGLYDKVGSAQEAEREDAFRHNPVPAPTRPRPNGRAA